MPHFLFSLGLVPVQSWIEEARRSRDLRAGSVILWWTMARVLHTLETELSSDLVLPPPPEGGFERLANLSLAKALQEHYGVPNRATGYCLAEGPERVQEVFQGLESGAVASAWAEVRGFLFDPDLTGQKHADRRAFFSTLRDHLETYAEATGPAGDCPFSLVWVAVPVEARPNDDAGLRRDLQTIDRLFLDVKRSRPIRPWVYGARVPKCNQCGRREVVGPRDSARRWRRWERESWNRLDWLVEGYVVDRDERLCPVCLARRLAAYPREERRDRWRFKSTGEVAATLWIEELQRADDELGRLVDQIGRTTLGREDLGRALYLSDTALAEPGHDKLRELRSELATRIETINREREQRLPTSPPPYLALLSFDGDSMGERIREDPKGVPERLERFQVEARKEIQEVGGESFYLAGDEGLAMVPVAAALDLALALRRRFEEAFDGLEVQPTLSVGVALFEQARPMRGAIQQAHRALQEAKALDDKNALGMYVETASGSRWGFVARWGPAWDRIRRASEWVREGRIAAAWAYDVEHFLESLSPADWKVLASQPAAVRAELRRLFVRRVTDESADREQKLEWWAELPGETWWEGKPTSSPQPDQFHLIGFLARQSGGGRQDGALDGDRGTG